MSISVWEQDTFFKKQNLVIVGGGFLGLWIAYELVQKHPKLSISIVDKGWPPAGASTRNAGFACFGSPSEIVADIQQMGEQATFNTIEKRWKGIKKIMHVFGAEAIGYEPIGGYELYDEATNIILDNVAERLPFINKTLQAITGKNETFTNSPSLLNTFGIGNATQLISNSLEGGLHSGKLHQALCEYVQAKGVQIVYNCEMTHYETSVSGVKIALAGGQVWNADNLILATNAWLSKQVPEMQIVPARGQIILSPPLQNFSLKGTFHYQEGYVYFRNLGNRLLIGGYRNLDTKTEETLELKSNSQIQEALYSFLKSKFEHINWPNLSEFANWSGIMARQANKQAILFSPAPNVLAAMCCNGMGVALAPIVAEEVVSTIFS